MPVSCADLFRIIDEIRKNPSTFPENQTFYQAKNEFCKTLERFLSSSSETPSNNLKDGDSFGSSSQEVLRECCHSNMRSEPFNKTSTFFNQQQVSKILFHPSEAVFSQDNSFSNTHLLLLIIPSLIIVGLVFGILWKYFSQKKQDSENLGFPLDEEKLNGEESMRLSNG